jgi:membrane associated rhomboid family serine protease
MASRFGTTTFTTKWIVAMLACSIFSTLDGGWLARWFALAPNRIFHGEIWRLVTWPLVEPGPMQLVFTCILIYRLGGELSVRWGERRLRRFVVEIVLLAGVVTCVLAAVSGRFVFRLGGWAMADALVIAWARQFPQRALLVYGIITLRGRDLVRLTIAVSIIYALYVSPVLMAPELVACAAAALYPRRLLRR